MTAHAKLSASGSSIWMNCLGSAHLNAGRKGTTSPYAIEGTNAHAMAEDLLSGKHVLPTTDEGNEMLEAVQVYVDFCRAITPAHLKSVAFIEQSVKLDDLWPGAKPIDPLFGQCDYICVHGKTLNVVDYKHGKGVPVEVKGNTQTRYYGLGALLMMEDPQITQVNMTIVQPRAPHSDGPVRTESMTALDLMMWGKNELKPIVDQIEVAKEGELPLTDGPWCRWCPSLGVCPQVHKKAMAVAQTDFEPTSPEPPKPQTLDNTQLTTILNASERIRAWLAAVQGEASSRIDQGQQIADWKLVSKRANRAWKDPANAELTMKAEGYGDLVIFVPEKLKSPTQILAWLKKQKFDPAFLDDQIHKPDTGTTLVPASDKRQEVASGPTLDFDIVSED